MKDKICIFVPTGEYRKVKMGEYFDMDDSVPIWAEQGKRSVGSYHIYKRYEIKIPEGTQQLDVSMSGTNKSYTKIIQFENTIKKVKKWKWVISVHGREIIVGYMTDEEMKRYVLAHGNIAYYQKIDKSEKEFPMEEV